MTSRLLYVVCVCPTTSNFSRKANTQNFQAWWIRAPKRVNRLFLGKTLHKDSGKHKQFSSSEFEVFDENSNIQSISNPLDSTTFGKPAQKAERYGPNNQWNFDQIVNRREQGDSTTVDCSSNL